MYEEKRVWTALKLSRIFRKHSTFYALKAQKNESLTHSLFFDNSWSKVIFRVTRKPCSARLPTTPPAPDGWCLPALGVVVAMPQSYSVSPERPPDGRTFGAFGWCVPVCERYAFSTPPDGWCLLCVVGNL